MRPIFFFFFNSIFPFIQNIIFAKRLNVILNNDNNVGLKFLFLYNFSRCRSHNGDLIIFLSILARGDVILINICKSQQYIGLYIFHKRSASVCIGHVTFVLFKEAKAHLVVDCPRPSCIDPS